MAARAEGEQSATLHSIPPPSPSWALLGTPKRPGERVEMECSCPLPNPHPPPRRLTSFLSVPPPWGILDMPLCIRMNWDLRNTLDRAELTKLFLATFGPPGQRPARSLTSQLNVNLSLQCTSPDNHSKMERVIPVSHSNTACL